MDEIGKIDFVQYVESLGPLDKDNLQALVQLKTAPEIKVMLEKARASNNPEAVKMAMAAYIIRSITRQEAAPPKSKGQLKLEAIKKFRKAQYDAGLDSSLAKAKVWVEEHPELFGE